MTRQGDTGCFLWDRDNLQNFLRAAGLHRAQAHGAGLAAGAPHRRAAVEARRGLSSRRERERVQLPSCEQQGRPGQALRRGLKTRDGSSRGGKGGEGTAGGTTGQGPGDPGGRALCRAGRPGAQHSVPRTRSPGGILGGCCFRHFRSGLGDRNTRPTLAAARPQACTSPPSSVPGERGSPLPHRATQRGQLSMLPWERREQGPGEPDPEPGTLLGKRWL